MENKIYNLYFVGGFVRDKLLGIKSKDIDFAFEFKSELEYCKHLSPTVAYVTMNNILKKEGFEIFLETPSCFTTRAKFPIGHKNEGLVADFVLCRKEVYDNPQSRKPTVWLGTIYDDLTRRDATVNAIAIDEDGKYLDPHGGIVDLFNGVLKCPLSPSETFMDDPLRMMRFLRFSVTKEFVINDIEYHEICNNPHLWDKFDKVVSKERVYEELLKMFKHDTLKTLELFEKLKRDASFRVMESIFRDGMWLKPTFEK